MPSAYLSARQAEFNTHLTNVIQYSLLFIFFLMIFGWIDPSKRIRQDLSYHNFADKRSGTFFGLFVPNFNDVVSNFPFFLLGCIGFIVTSSVKLHSENERLPLWIIFFGVTLVSFGSSWYHWTPNNSSLVLDRLPMTFCFIGMYCWIIEDRIGGSCGIRLLTPLLSLGILSIVLWHIFDNLALYVWIQFFPLLTIPFILYHFPSLHYTDDGGIQGMFVLYLLAKLCEVFDKGIFFLTGNYISGHTLKHLLAALVPALHIWILSTRTLLSKV